MGSAAGDAGGCGDCAGDCGASKPLSERGLRDVARKSMGML